MRTDHTGQTLLLFSVSGLLAGLITLFTFAYGYLSILDLGGLAFLTGFIASFVVARLLGWLRVTYRPGLWATFGILILAIHPTSLWAMQFSTILIDFTRHRFSHSESCTYLPCDGWVGYFVPLSVILIISVAVQSIALLILTQRWSTRGFALFVVTGVGAMWNSLVLTLFLHDMGFAIRINGEDWTLFATLAVVGESLFSAVSANWLAKTSGKQI